MKICKTCFNSKKVLLVDNFRKQAEGTFAKEDISQFVLEIVSLLKPENVEEVQSVMKQFAQNTGK